MEEHLDADGNIQQTNEFQPREDPFDPKSAPLPININRLTCKRVIFMGVSAYMQIRMCVLKFCQ